MNNKGMDIKVIGLYFKRQWKGLGLAIVCVGVFLLTFALMQVPFRYVWYPTLICAVFFLGYLVFDMIRFVRRHRELQRIKKHIDITLDNLPEAETVIEEDYQELLGEMMLRKNQQISDFKTAQNEMTEYVTTWTHQIKTPLTALRLVASDLEESVRPEVMMRLFEIEQYTDMMLQYLRLESESTDYVLKEYFLQSMVNQAVKYFARIFISKGIAVKIEIAEGRKIVTDEKWMVFVLKQLISNALKYTKQGNIHIYMQDAAGDLHNGEKEGSTERRQEAILVIEDTGIGIAKDDLPRIFERGYTGYNGRKDKKATGLGLFLTDRILKQLNHKITITSEVGVGTKVVLCFNKIC